MSSVTPQTIMARAKETLNAIGRKGGDAPASLISALADYKALPGDQQTADSEIYQRLELEIGLAEQAAVAQPDRPRVNWPRSLFNSLMVCISIVIMIVVAQLSIFYEDGKSLLVDLKAFQSQRMERHISQLERQLIYAKSEAAGSVTGAGSTNPAVEGASADELTSALALERYYDLFFDLKDADRVVSALVQRSTQFWNESFNPAPVLTPIVAPIQRWYFGSYADIVAQLPPAGSAIPSDPCANYTKILERLGERKGTMWLQLVADGRDACLFSLDNRIANYALTLPSMQEQINLIEARLKPYSVWILPVSFSIFGALMFYMRLILNEQLPTPSLTRVVHRIALSAVAAVVLSLFWSSLFSPNGEFEAVGFTVFTLAFVIGFSIDIFFSYLDRTVAVAVGVIEKDESQSEKGKSLAAAANG